MEHQMKKILLGLLLFFAIFALSAKEIIVKNAKNLDISKDGKVVMGLSFDLKDEAGDDDGEINEGVDDDDEEMDEVTDDDNDDEEEDDDDRSLSIQIPEGVTEIAAEAFCGKENIVSVKLPSTLTKIGDRAFADCTGLKKINLPRNLKIIGAEAFAGCENLKLSLPDKIAEIGEGAFASCERVRMKGNNDKYQVDNSGALIDIGKNILLYFPPDSDIYFRMPHFIERIGKMAFQDSSIVGIIFNKKLRSIGQEAFAGCDMLHLTIPAGVSEIGEGAFYMCGKVDVDKNNRDFIFDKGALIDVKNKILLHHHSDYQNKTYKIPSSVSIIGIYAFAESSLFKVTIPGSVKQINREAFADSVVDEIIFDHGVKSIDNYAFAGCEQLQEVHFPRSIESIGNFAFYNCKQLRKVTFSSQQVKVGNYVFLHTKCEKSVKQQYPSLFRDKR